MEVVTVLEMVQFSSCHLFHRHQGQRGDSSLSGLLSVGVEAEQTFVPYLPH